MNEFLLPLSIITFLIVINGLFVAAEFAIAAAPRARIAQMAEEGSPAARHVLGILRQPELLNRYISTAQVGITIASLGLGMYGEHVLAEWFLEPLEQWGWLGIAGAHTVATISAVTLLTYFHVVVGEMVPKSLALQAADQAAIRLVQVMTLADQIFRPLTIVLNQIGNFLLRLFGIASDMGTRLVSSAELEYILAESTKGGLLEPAEQVYLENVLDFSERTIGQVMTPRTRLATLAVTASLPEVMSTLQENQHSRYPVFAGDRDHIVGILHIKDLARYIQQAHLLETENQFTLSTLLRPVVFVPETLSLEQMLDRFRQEHIQVAIVVDEFGGTAGLVTMEDLVEEIIGEIQDEFDTELPPFSEIAPQVLRVRGDLLLDELNQHYELNLTNLDVDTVGGLIMATLGHLAQPGESVTYGNLRFEVESVEGLAISSALLYLPTPPITTAADQDSPHESTI
ncbi:MAG: HlyC/CorC family transporter [Caldilineaceae bacterium]|nr:HlyC/CorC family transporter [Caldilineaceae bacterium]